MRASRQPGEVWHVDFGYDAKPRYCLVVSVPDPAVRLASASVVQLITQPGGTPYEVTLPCVPWLREQSCCNVQAVAAYVDLNPVRAGLVKEPGHRRGGAGAAQPCERDHRRVPGPLRAAAEERSPAPPRCAGASRSDHDAGPAGERDDLELQRGHALEECRVGLALRLSGTGLGVKPVTSSASPGCR
jgi:hypothetical protein